MIPHKYDAQEEGIAAWQNATAAAKSPLIPIVFFLFPNADADEHDKSWQMLTVAAKRCSGGKHVSTSAVR